jgi:predicted component of viral defense system (DUF524 family)
VDAATFARITGRVVRVTNPLFGQILSRAACTGYLPAQVEEVQVVGALDTPENRFVKSFLE